MDEIGDYFDPPIHEIVQKKSGVIQFSSSWVKFASYNRKITFAGAFNFFENAGFDGVVFGEF